MTAIKRMKELQLRSVKKFGKGRGLLTILNL